MPEPSTSSSHSPRQRILEAAARLFRDKGYAATSMRDLARLVDLKASSLYNHIQGKEDLLRLICFANARRFLQAMETVEQQNGLDPAERVLALVRLHVEMALKEATSITAFNDEWRHLSEPHLSRFVAMRRDYEERFLRILRDGMAQGVIRDMDPRVLLYTLLSSVRWLYDGYRAKRFPEAEEVARQVVSLLLHGLAPLPEGQKA